MEGCNHCGRKIPPTPPQDSKDPDLVINQRIVVILLAVVIVVVVVDDDDDNDFPRNRGQESARPKCHSNGIPSVVVVVGILVNVDVHVSS